MGQICIILSSPATQEDVLNLEFVQEYLDEKKVLYGPKTISIPEGKRKLTLESLTLNLFLPDVQKFQGLRVYSTKYWEHYHSTALILMLLLYPQSMVVGFLQLFLRELLWAD